MAENSPAAQGDLIDLIGQIRNINGDPIDQAKVEIWQTDRFGRYIHRLDRDRGQRDQHFQGWGIHQTDATGRYRFRTIKPVAYRAGSQFRTPHIHFKVAAPGYRTLVTQMYFAGERLNQQDFVYQSLSSEAAKAQLTVALQPNPQGEGEIAQFNIYLSN